MQDYSVVTTSRIMFTNWWTFFTNIRKWDDQLSNLKKDSIWSRAEQSSTNTVQIMRLNNDKDKFNSYLILYLSTSSWPRPILLVFETWDKIIFILIKNLDRYFSE